LQHNVELKMENVNDVDEMFDRIKKLERDKSVGVKSERSQPKQLRVKTSDPIGDTKVVEELLNLHQRFDNFEAN